MQPCALPCPLSHKNVVLLKTINLEISKRGLKKIRLANILWLKFLWSRF